MNNIPRIGSYDPVSAIGASPQSGPARSAEQASGSSPEGTDEVEISQLAQFLSKIAQMPDVRQEKVEEIRQSLAAGNYDIEGKLPKALDQLLQEYLG